MKHYLVLCLILSFFFTNGYAVQENHSNAFDSNNILAEFHIAKGGDLIFLPVTFKGKEYLFLFDTGCSMTVFDPHFKAELGKPKKVGQARVVGGVVSCEIFDAPQAFVGSLNLGDCNDIMCTDLKDINLLAEKSVSGVIGMNWLKKYIIQINFDEGVLYFLKSVNDKKYQLGNELPFRYSKLGLPVVSGNIPEGIRIKYKTYFVIDSGAADTGSLERGIFKEILKSEKVKTSQAFLQTPIGTIASADIRLEDIYIDRFHYRGLIFDDGDLPSLGLDFLSRHIVTFDFPGHKIYLEGGREFHRIDESNMSGLGLIRKDLQTKVYLVYDSSPAQQAGIKTNDVILKVDGKDANTYSLAELKKFLQRDKQTVTMTIQHGNDVNEVSFVLKRRI
jgi:hypothetical protein